MIRISGCVMLATLLWATPIEAEPIVSLLPPGNTTIVAAPGDTVGWGYEIVNDDPVHWLVLSAPNADLFEHGTITDPLNIFDFPILAPASTWTTPYMAGVSGLYEFTWDLTAPAGFINTGVFRLGVELWDGDPFAGGQFASALPDLTASYAVSVSTPPAAVPEPGTLLLLGMGLSVARFVRRRPSR
jgi:hypothetical protein